MGTVSRAAGTSVQQENKYGANKFPYDLLSGNLLSGNLLSGNLLSGDLGARLGLRALAAGDDVGALLVLRAPRFGDATRLAWVFAAGTGSAWSAASNSLAACRARSAMRAASG